VVERRTHLSNVLLALQMLQRRLQDRATDARIADIGLRSARALAALVLGPDDPRGDLGPTPPRNADSGA